MSRVLWFGSMVLLLLGVVLQIAATQRYIAQAHPQVLTTPNGLALIPLTFSIPDNVFYLRPYAEQADSAQPSQLRYIQALLPVYAGVFFFWFTALFLYVFSRVRRLERAYILFAAAVVTYLLLFVDFFTWHVSGNIFLFYNVLIIGPFLYLFR
ncbi:MAG TPA: hypothetical protein PKY99_11675, partial [Turneriella sp.]|nr:hypothetical protein [Turneriella sp.]